MAISFIDSVAQAIVTPGASGTMSLSSMPTHAAGDLLLFYATCNGYSVIPLPPSNSGLVVCEVGSFSTLRSVVGYKIAASGSETSGTWTNGVTHLGCLVYRSSVGMPVLGFSANNSGTVGSGGNINYAANPKYSTSIAETWFVGLVTHRQVNTDIEVAPSGMTNRDSVQNSVGEIAMHDTNGNSASWPSTNYTLTAGTSSVYLSHVFELLEVTASSGGSIIVVED